MMKRLKALLAALIALTAGCTAGTESAKEKKTYAMWFSYLDYQDMSPSQDEKEFTAQVEEAIANMKNLGINTVYVHAVAYTDAYYASGIYPRADILAGSSYDPLAIFVEKAHENDMEVEAWVNPLRSIEVGKEDTLPEDSPIRTWIKLNDERVRQVNGRYYLNPAYQEVRDLVVSVVREILNGYDVDGIHFDDYFYPDGTDRRFDAYIYSVAQDQKADLDLGDFRRSNIDLMVQEVHDAAKEKGRRFTISVAGNLDNDLTMYYADPAAWISQGTVDVLIPQVYWGYDHPVKPYEATLQSWYDMAAGSDTKVMAGIAAYKVGTTDSYAGTASTEWKDSTDMLARQTATALNMGCSGAAYFRYGSLFRPAEDVQAAVLTETENLQEQIAG